MIARHVFLVVALAIGFSTAVAGTEIGATTVPTVSAPPSLAGALDSSWASAAEISLKYDYTFRRPASELTTVKVAADRSALYVAFDVAQRAVVKATTMTNGSGVSGDDYVAVYLYPGGTQGFQYSFAANPLGTRYQTSSENTAYSPEWTAAAVRRADGYSVTMRIPFEVIRSAGLHSWKAQFVRYTAATTGMSVWTYSPSEAYAEDPAFAGSLNDVVPAGVASSPATRPRARAQIYGLGQAAAAAAGGTTSRAGVDLSLPFTRTASFLATIHPDYSNLEVDQQTIAPTAFVRQYNEVRPFFTQNGAFNNHFGCFGCPVTLYTPAIPAFGQGYAVEGTAGPYTFGGFDALGTNRSDDAEAVDFNVSTPTNAQSVSVQRVTAHVPGVTDTTTTFDAGYQNVRSHLMVFTNLGADRGNLVTDPSRANYAELGFGYTSSTTSAIVDLKDEGAQFLPYDGYVSQPDLRGYRWVLNRTWTNSDSATIRDWNVSASAGRYADHAGNVALIRGSYSLNLDLKNQFSFGVQAAPTAVRAFDGSLLPFDANGGSVGYRLQTTTPTYVAYSGGPYFHGKVGSWTYFTALPLPHHLTASFELDENQYGSRFPGEHTVRQWLERETLDWQFNRFASVDLGLRTIFGSNVPNAYAPPDFTPYRGGNLSVAFHLLRGANELYLVYGDPNSFSTTPAIDLKIVRYIGANKGT